MSCLVPDDFNYDKFKDDAESSGTSGDDALREFAKLFEFTKHNFQLMAYNLRYAEEHGKDLSEVKEKINGLYVALQRIAYGQLLPEIPARYHDKLTLVRRLSSLPIKDQQEVITVGVRLLTYTPTGEQTHMVIDPGNMTREQINQALASDHIKTDAEQAAYLANWRTKVKRPLPSEFQGWKIDPDLGIAKFGQKAHTLEELEAIVRLLRKGRRDSA